MIYFKTTISNPEMTYSVSVGKKKIPDNKVVRVNLGSTAAVQQDPRITHNGTAPVVLVLHGGCSRQQTVEVLRDVCGAVAIENIVDDVSRFQSALQNRDISLGIEEPQDVLPVNEKRRCRLVMKDCALVRCKTLQRLLWRNVNVPDVVGEGLVEGPVV